ncbi:MAG: hypothetical protein KBT57_04515 [bacterium]|nr:hypothetical protein [Candidatus Limimorpha equi]
MKTLIINISLILTFCCFACDGCHYQNNSVAKDYPNSNEYNDSAFRLIQEYNQVNDKALLTEAKYLLDTAIKLDSTNMTAYMNLLNVLNLENDTAAVIKTLNQLLVSFDNKSLAYGMIIGYYREQNKPQAVDSLISQAKSYYRNQLSKRTDDELINDMIGFILFSEGIEKAGYVLDSCLRLYPDSELLMKRKQEMKSFSGECGQ